jgi:parallel beta-helix repeat protein
MQGHHTSAICGLIAALYITACSSGYAAPQAPGPDAGPPQLSALDALPGIASHGSSALEDIPVDLLLPLQGQGWTDAGAGAIELTAQPGAIAHAIYRVALPEGPLLHCDISRSGPRLYVYGADYASGRWTLLLGPGNGSQQISMAALEDYSSPGGYFYFAAVASAPSGGSASSNTLEALSLTWDKPVEGPAYYVAPPADGGNDGNPGTSEQPWATLQHAADTVVAGDTVVVRPGSYVGFMLQSSGAPGAPITFSGLPGAVINERNDTTPDGINLENWGDGGAGAIHHIVIEGLSVTGTDRAGIRFVGGEEEHAHHITVRNCESYDNQVWGILSGHADDVLVEDCVLHDNHEQHGVYLSNSSDRCTTRGNIIYGNDDCGIHHNGDVSLGGDGVMSNCLIENNIIYNNGFGDGGSAINCDGVQDSIIRNNLVFGNGASGISLYMIDAGEPATGNTVVNNTIVMPGGNARWCLNVQNDSGAGLKVYNNIFFNYHSFRGAIDINDASLPGFESDYNVVIARFVINDGNQLDLGEWRSATGQDMHSIEADPASVLADPLGTAPADFLPLVTGAAYNAALPSQAPPLDLTGTARPQGSGIEIGCYELP